ncbi:uncharacterized protein LOC133832443 [Humulus lupulus]|uniref:uncharacterized protein LOC133832443 n=1 Tax=Humulus lupulus TaxID=3486 RepID=UPI002B40C571|nr:uncharacterized protein LOC133832443 [Humulus lupulus]
MSFFAEGNSITRPPLLNDTNYPYWKVRMRAFIKSQVRRLGDLYSRVGLHRLKKMMKVIQRRRGKSLKLSFEGTVDIKRSRFTMLQTRFDELRMWETENLSEFYEKLSDIANEFFALGEKLDESVLKKGKPNPSIEKTKVLHLKLMKKDVSDDEKDDEMALLTRNFQKFMKKVGNKNNFSKAPKGNTSSKPFVSNNKKGIQCRECDGYGHIQSKCANTLKKNKKGFNVTWSDDDSESSDEVNEKVALTNVLSSAFQERGKILCLKNTLIDVDKKEIDSDSDESELNEESLVESYKVMYGIWLQVYTENRSLVKMNKELSHNIKDLEENNKCCEFELCSKISEIVFLTKELDKLKRNFKMLNPGSNIFEEIQNSAEGSVSTEMKQSGKRENSHGKKKCFIPSCHFCGVKARNVIGMGTLNFEGLPRLKNIVLVEGLRANLLSVNQICDQGYTVNFDSNRCYVVNDQDEIILQGFRPNDNCYTLTTYATYHSAIDSSTDLWHEKLEHIHFKILKKLSNAGIVRGLQKLVLELLHMDLMGPIQVESLNDFNIGKIVWIRSDHGKEFENTVYDEFCKSKGISHEFSAPKTPQQNGVVERKNRTLIEMARVYKEGLGTLQNSGTDKFSIRDIMEGDNGLTGRIAEVVEEV